LSEISDRVKLNADCKFDLADNLVDIETLIIVDLNTENKTD